MPEVFHSESASDKTQATPQESLNPKIGEMMNEIHNDLSFDAEKELEEIIKNAEKPIGDYTKAPKSLMALISEIDNVYEDLYVLSRDEKYLNVKEKLTEYVFEKATKLLEEKTEQFNGGFILYCIKFIKDPKIVEKLTKSVAARDPRIALIMVKTYKDQSYAEEIIRKTAKEAPFMALVQLDEYEDKPYALDIIMNILEENPILLEITPSNFIKNHEKEIEELKKHHATEIDLAKESKNIPQKLIQPEDFPMDQEKVKIYIKSLNTLTYISIELVNEKGYPMISIPQNQFFNILFSANFQKEIQKKTGQITWMNVFSLVHATYRDIEKNKLDINEKNINDSITKILKKWDETLNREIFGPNTNLILFEHEDNKFDDNLTILDKVYYPSGGKKENVLANERGMKIANRKVAEKAAENWHLKHGGTINKEYLDKLLRDKQNFNLAKIMTLYAIANAKGPTTIFFNGHGSPENWAFSANEANNLSRTMDKSDKNISYQELGDTLIASKNIKEFNILGGTCFAYNYILNMFGYIESMGISDKPNVSITAANKDRYGINGGAPMRSKELSAVTFYKNS